MEEEDYIHSNSTLSSLWCSCSYYNGSKAAAIAAHSFSLFSRSLHSLNPLNLLSTRHASL